MREDRSRSVAISCVADINAIIINRKRVIKIVFGKCKPIAISAKHIPNTN